MSPALLLLVALTASPKLGAALPDAAPAHLGLVLRLEDRAGLEALIVAQQDPTSSSYHQYLTPDAFGSRFGVPAASYEAMVRTLEEAGFRVQRAPNRLFLDATGTVGGVRRLLGVQLREVEGEGRVARSFAGGPTLPAAFAGRVLHVSGLDTRVHLRRRINASGGTALGADDLRLQYDMTPYISAGTAAAGLSTAVLGTQEGTSTHGGNVGPPFIPPSTTAIQTYFTSIAHATAVYTPEVLANPNDDFDSSGSNQEYQLDVEMQSVGAANADAIYLVLSPSSEVFTTGAQYIANSLSGAVAVSLSLGLCEYEEAQYYGGSPTTAGSEMAAMQQAVAQGLSEGQTWFAAAGDSGADDCADGTHNQGFGGGSATVDFPASLPEIVALGGSEFTQSGQFDGSGALIAAQPEETWNEGNQGGAGGGGQSRYYAKPAWQVGIGPNAGDGTRDVPDFSLTAATGLPGVAVYDCGTGQDQSCQGETTGAGLLDIFGGTSVSSPLAAGIFALVAGQAGCKLGDVHPTLYALGTAQQSGGAAVYRDLATRNNNLNGINGFAAASGYDLATGWGTLDVAQLVSAWPACSSTSGGSSGSTGTTSTGSTSTTTGGSTGSGSTSTTTGGSTTGGSTGSGSTSTTTGGSTGSGSSSTTTGGTSGSTSGSTGSSGSVSGSSTGGAASSTGAGASAGGSSGSGTSGASSASGCGCDAHGSSDVLGFGVFFVLALVPRRKRRGAMP